MKVLITGGNGFIGSHLIKALISKGHQIQCLVRPTSNLNWLKSFKIKYHYGNLSNSASLAQTVSEVDQIFHLGGLTKARSEDEYLRINAQGTENILSAVQKNNPRLQRFILVSSLAAAGPAPTRTPINETTPPAPITPYGRSKARAEAITLSYGRQFPVTIIRPPAVYGPRDTDVYAIFKYVKMGIKPRLCGPERLTSLIHVDDLVQGLILASNNEKAIGNCYFLADTPQFTWNEITTTIQHVLKNRAFTIPIPPLFMDGVAGLSELFAGLTKKAPLLNRYKVLEMKQLYWICDNTKAKRELGFAPQVDLKTGIKDTVEWYLQHRWL